MNLHFLLIGLGVVVLLSMILWVFPKRQMKKLEIQPSSKRDIDRFERDRDRLKLVDDARKTLAQILGGLVVLVGLILTYYSYQLNVDKQDLDRERQMTDRFSKAIEHLADEKQSIRLGGLFELERISKDSPKDFSSAMEVISSFIREKSPFQKTTYDEKKENEIIYLNIKYRKYQDLTEEEKNYVLPEEIKLALKIIGRREIKSETDHKVLNLRGININKADLSNLEFSDVDFSGSNLYGVNFRESKLLNANLSDSILYNCNFYKGKIFDSEITNSDLRQAKFLETEISNSDLSYSDCTLTEFIGTVFKQLEFFDSNFYLTDFSRADLHELIIRENGEKQFQNSIFDENTKFPDRLSKIRTELMEKSNINKENLRKINKEASSKLKIQAN
jgi:uncharacterized protein YjbI with pentapeptide repeats